MQTDTKPKLERMPSKGLLKTFSADDLRKEIRPELETYKTVMKSLLLGTHKVAVETKKVLKKLRGDNNISEREHDQLLGQFGWTPEDYEGELDKSAGNLL